MEEVSDEQTHTRVTWNEENNVDVVSKIAENLDSLLNMCTLNENGIENVNICVESFTQKLNNLILPYCSVTTYKAGLRGKRQHKAKCGDKPWFNDLCKKRYDLYKQAIYIFNGNKNEENRIELLRLKKIYKRLESKLKREYMSQQGNMLNYLRKYNPKTFYRHFKKRKKSTISDLNNNDFLNHFRNLASNEPNTNDDVEDFLSNYDQHTNNPLFKELNSDITEQEISEAIHKLKNNKACGYDNVLNEYFINCGDVLMPCLLLLFNNVFKSGYFPHSWSTGCIIPVFKKGNANDADNYRGITLVSCLGKLFTSVINERLLKFDQENDIITDAQFGFRKDMSTIDAAFILQFLINRTLKNKKRLYCCFVDYKKAFHFVNRQKLWYKMIQLGVNGNILAIIRSLYDNVKCCVKYNNEISDFFNCKNGLLQGEVLSPILFSMYVNDCEMHLLADDCPSVVIHTLNLFLVMYADDMVLLAESPEGLQQNINALLNYTMKWDLTVNTNKTKIVVFRNGGKIRKNEKWFYNGYELEVVNEFNYLGLLFFYNGKFSRAQKRAAEQGRKALFYILNVCNKNFFNIETMLSVFDTYVNSVLSYGAEVWGFHTGQDVEKIHIQFCKKILGVRKGTCNDFVYSDLGRFPLQIIRKLRIFKYWIKMRNSKNCILRALYEEMNLYEDNWLMNVKRELNLLGLNYVWNLTQVNNNVYNIIKQRICDVFKQHCYSRTLTTSKGNLYRHLLNEFKLQTYLIKPIDKQHLKEIVKIRISAHKLNIESGRYKNIDRTERICNVCNSNDIEDEYHFILQCPLYNDLRKKLIKIYYYRNPSVFKLIQLLTTENNKELNNLGKYLIRANKIRDQHMELH